MIRFYYISMVKDEVIKKAKEKSKLSGHIGRLIHGERSELFQKWLKKHHLELPDLPQYDDWLQELKARIVWIEIKKRELEYFLEFYRTVGKKGLLVIDELMDLESQIARREMKLIKEGKDPLEDKPLQQAKKRRLELIKFIEKLKWDKEKFYITNELKQAQKHNKDLFTVETEYEVLGKNQELREKVEQDDN